MSGTIETRACHEWMTRPDDERFASVAELHARAERDDTECREYHPVDRRACVVSVASDGSLRLFDSAALTHWSMGQVAGLAGAPASYLRELPGELAAKCLNHGLRSSGVEDARVIPYLRERDGRVTVRALTGPKYERIRNSTVTAALARAESAGWSVPPAWDAAERPSGLYLGDRSMFAFMVDDSSRSIVTNPKASARASKREFGRAFMLWNSEEGGTSFGLALFLFDFVCGNHILWGVSWKREVRLRHVGDVRTRIRRGLASAGLLQGTHGGGDLSAELDGIKAAMTTPLLTDGSLPYGSDAAQLDALIKGARQVAPTVPVSVVRAGIKQAWEDGDDPRYRYGLVNGITAAAQRQRNADTRTDWDRWAASFMPKVRGLAVR